MAYDNPPRDANPENLLTFCHSLTDGSRKLEEMADDSDLELSLRTLRDIKKYGIKLGFIAEDEDGNLSLTDRGWDVAFSEDVDETVEDAFRIGIGAYPLYTDLIDKIIEEDLVEEGESEQITRQQILPLLNRAFGFSELSTDGTLNPATNTFLQTLDAAGYGEYVVGRRGGSTRIEVNNDFLDLEREHKKKSSKREVGEQEEKKQEEEEKKSEQEQAEVSEKNGEVSLKKTVTTGELAGQINIEIHVSSEDWSSEEMIEFVDELRNTDAD